MHPDEIEDLIKSLFGSFRTFTSLLSVNRSMPYLLKQGSGSRQLRVTFALLAGRKPSVIWPLNTRIVRLQDDYLYDLCVNNGLNTDMVKNISRIYREVGELHHVI